MLGSSFVRLAAERSADVSFAGNLQLIAWSPLHAFQREFVTHEGLHQYPLPNGIYYALAPANLALFGPLLAP